MEKFADLAAKTLNQVLDSPAHSISAEELEIPPDPKLGDFAFPCFKLAKQFRKGPPQVAQELVSKIQAIPEAMDALKIIGMRVAATGPYVNFLVNDDVAVGFLLSQILSGSGLGSFGKLPAESRGCWVLEYSSPNVAKPFQIYHLRPTALGAAMDRIGRFRGFRMASINHLGDWGTQYGKIAVALQIFPKDLPPNPTIKDLVDIYVKFHAAAEKDPTLDDRAREAFAKLENDDPEMTALWKKCVDISMKEFNRIYDRLGVHFDHFWGESFYKHQLTPLLEDLRKKGLLVESEGAWIVNVTDTEGKELPPCILQKKDGATIYATRDVAAALYRYKHFKFDRMTYIVGGEQRLHFQQVFGVLRKMGMEWASKCEHVPTGLYRFKDAKMSTRKGNFVTLEDVLALAKERVVTLMEEREKNARPGDAPVEISDSEKEEITEAIAVGAVMFHDLSTDPARDVEFDVERVVDFEGETGPYLQYAHTRCLSLLRKAQAKNPKLPKEIGYDAALVSQLSNPYEVLLTKQLGQLPVHLERTLKFAKASQLAHYLIDVTKAFGAFYRECQVITEDEKLTRARLMLVEGTRRILAQGLGLLGIPTPAKM